MPVKTAREYVGLFSWGSGDKYDPDHAEKSDTPDEILQIATLLMDNKETVDGKGAHYFTPWDQGFIIFCAGTARNVYLRSNKTDHGLSGKKLVILKKLWRKLVAKAKEDFPA